ncbi:MAG: sulfatase-like hydrolase/transferase [Gammaproteobacteria bacterium]|nr:sulfatase-like hydrolase/transferase [Gammaproteobacteria bacterium]
MAGRGVLAVAMVVAAAAAAARPNVVVILADDLGYGDVGANGGTMIATPHIDALAARGVRLTQGYVSHPVCSPSRAGLITGRYQQRHGWEFNPAGRDRAAGMSTEEQTLADVMRAAGYRTGLIGKWHLGSEPEHHPVNRGFDEFFGMVEGGSIYIDADVPGVESWGSPRIGRPNKIIRGLEEEVVVQEYLTDRFTDEAVDFIERHARSPFFLFLSHKTPHTPLQATAKYLDRYRHLDDDAARVYAAMVASLDDSVGAVVAALEREGLRDDSLIVFLSDNGCAGYVANACSNAPLRGFKRHFHEGGIRVPFIVSWPNALPEGGVFRHMAVSLDLMDTFLAAAGRGEASDDSVDLKPYLDGTDLGAPHDYLYWRSGPNWAVRDQRWKLIRYNRTGFARQDLDRSGRLIPPDGGWPNDSPHGQVTLLYDLANDPSESINYAAGRPELVERLTKAWERWNGENAPEPILPAYRSTLGETHGETVQLVF